MKYAALLLNGLAVLLLGWGTYGVAQLVQARGPVVRPIMVELAPLPTALQGDQTRMMEALGAMSRLQTQSFSSHAGAENLLALPTPGSDVVGSVQMPTRSLSVHLENLAVNTQSVMIDGRLAQRGTRLHHGGRVSQVQPSEVVVTEQLGRQTLSLPLSELRVGTLRWADGSPASVNTQQFRSGLAGSAPSAVKVTP
ncbi:MULTISPECIES: hypothetical protein [Giesbergeria]|uniref:Type II secretion system protein GspC N-terminal domain-containing protein n=1 Tax=Giesbergeria sinuosa TaxID=80883 RepID=A0ABV9QG65_9BURK